MHLSPLSLNIQPVLADYDHSLRLYPLPTTVRECIKDTASTVGIDIKYLIACLGRQV